MSEERGGDVKFKGVVRETNYNQFTEREFPVPTTTFRTTPKSAAGRTNPPTYALTSMNRPPLVNGHFVEGSAYRLDQGSKGVIFVVRKMVLMDKPCGNVLCFYGPID